jgi:hypothetical protein
MSCPFKNCWAILAAALSLGACNALFTDFQEGSCDTDTGPDSDSDSDSDTDSDTDTDTDTEPAPACDDGEIDPGMICLGDPMTIGCCGYSRVKIAQIADTDTHADVVAVDTEEYNIKRARGNGDGTFISTVWESPAGVTDIFDVIVEDLDGDDYKDLVFSDSEFLMAYLGDFNENFSAGWVAEDYLGFPMQGMSNGFFNSDTYPDLVVTRPDDLAFNVILLDSVGDIIAAYEYTTVLALLDAAVGDFDGDGDQDIAVTTATDGGTPSDLATGDVNDDGSPDLGLAADDATIVLISNP